MPDRTIRPLDETSLASSNIAADNIQKLRELFPECFVAGTDDGGPRFRVDFGALREALGDAVESHDECYSFTWFGKAQARRTAQKQTVATLRPCHDDSVDWDATGNVFIEGEALEVLKTLQKAYHRNVQLVFVDPPFNKRSDRFVPGDNPDSLETYLRLYTGPEPDRITLKPNTDTSGLFHSRWLSMKA